MKKRSGVLWAVLIIVLAAIVFVYRDRIHFDWANFKQQIQHIHWGHAIAGIILIYITYWLRAIRWSVMVRPTKEVSAGTLIGPQFIGFTAVALFGRLADLTRPYLVARKSGRPLSSQIAVYTLERMFDLGAAALI
ncbi:MAG TPA: lysylphosphatidylglycerol synthase domain-containing protein, partial [Edaphobacter sp.]|nr:lysylphosphatidylglycerol synthase domain-containing protein [Edaphobacter sp.]